MKVIQATSLRRQLFETLKRLAYEREPLLIERRGKPIAALVPPESVAEAARRESPPSTALPSRPLIDPKALADFCEKHRVKTLYLFGSILTDRFDADSDVDVMFEAHGPSPGFFEQAHLGAQTLLQKPFSQAVLLERVRQLMPS